jgi:hypothetical protein
MFFAMRAHHPFFGDAARQRIQIQRHDLVQFFVAGLGARQDQQLVDHVRSAVGAFGDQLQRVAHLRRIGFRKRDLGLGLEPGQRRAHLVRGLGDEALLRLQVLFQAPHHLVEGDHQRTHLFRHAGYGYRRQVGRTAPVDAILQQAQGGDAAHQAHVNQDHRQRNDGELRQQHAGNDAGRQGLALFQGFRNLHHDRRHACSSRAGKRRQYAHCRHRCGRHAAEPCPRSDLVRQGWRRNLLVALDDTAVGADYLVVERIGIVSAQQAARPTPAGSP